MFIRGKNVINRLIALVSVVTVMISTGGCGRTCVKLEDPSRPDAVNIAIISVTPWDRYVSELQPKFKMDSADEALNRIAIATLLEERSLTKKIASKTEAYAGLSPDMSLDKLMELVNKPKDAGDAAVTAKPADKPDETQENGKKYPLASFGLTSTVPIDSINKYKLATALFEEVKMLNRAVKDAAMRSDCTPFIVRLQASVMPNHTREKEYYIDTDFSFFVNNTLAPSVRSMQSAGSEIFAVPDRFGNEFSDLQRVSFTIPKDTDISFDVDHAIRTLYDEVLTGVVNNLPGTIVMYGDDKTLFIEPPSSVTFMRNGKTEDLDIGEEDYGKITLSGRSVPVNCKVGEFVELQLLHNDTTGKIASYSDYASNSKDDFSAIYFKGRLIRATDTIRTDKDIYISPDEPYRLAVHGGDFEYIDYNKGNEIVIDNIAPASSRYTSPFVVPILVSDNVEASILSDKNENILEIAGEIAASLKYFGISESLSYYKDELDKSYSRKFNTLMTVGRVTDNTLRARVGSLKVKDDEFMQPAGTHYITLLLLVPKNSRSVDIVSGFTIVDAKSGYPVVKGDSKVFDDMLDAFWGKYSDGDGQADEKGLRELITAVQQNRWDEYNATINRYFRNIENLNSYKHQAWLDLAKILSRSRYSVTSFEVPDMTKYELKEPPAQAVLLMDDGSKTVARLRGGCNMKNENLVAKLCSDRKCTTPIISESVKLDEGGANPEFTFPSLWKWGLVDKKSNSGYSLGDGASLTVYSSGKPFNEVYGGIMYAYQLNDTTKEATIIPTGLEKAKGVIRVGDNHKGELQYRLKSMLKDKVTAKIKVTNATMRYDVYEQSGKSGKWVEKSSPATDPQNSFRMDIQPGGELNIKMTFSEMVEADPVVITVSVDEVGFKEEYSYAVKQTVGSSGAASEKRIAQLEQKLADCEKKAGKTE